MFRWLTFAIVLLAGSCAGWEAFADARKPDAAGRDTFQTDIKPLLNRYCDSCHGAKTKGDLNLRIYTDESVAKSNAPVFEKILSHLENHEMPPEKKPQPTTAQRKLIVGWIEARVFDCDCNHPDSGRVTLRRLNRVEYNNTVHDLLGVRFKPADDFPADDIGYGFDNIGDVLSLSPMLMEKYLAAAENIMAAALPGKSSTNQPAGPLRHLIADGGQTDASGRAILANFARRAYRRRVTDEEVDRLWSIVKQTRKNGETFEGAIKLAFEAVLVSPNFLFRGEFQTEPDNPRSIHPIDDYPLATRLSYFLWSSMPDDELFALADKHVLRKNLEAQVKRMLKDPKARALVENFGDQWLQIRKLAVAAPDHQTFPEFDEDLRSAMFNETELFFQSIMESDRSVLDFINADYTFLNERLARHYGIKGVKGTAFQRVRLNGTRRGGLLTQASILTITSTPTRTSPVKRGKWVLENILGAPPPPPPPGVPVFKENGEAALTGTLRQRMEQHRVDPACASCHERMDPIGFGMENYDGVGAWRVKDGNFALDATGQLVSGESFQGAADLREILFKKKRDQFVHCLSEKMLTYALGRGLERYDKCAVDQIAKDLERNHYRFSTLILEVARSVPFQMRRGENSASGTAAN